MQQLAAEQVSSGWNAFWNGPTTIYVCDRHRHVHYQQIADDIVALIPQGGARVLDFGCGEALSAATVADHAGSLVLCDAAETVRAGLARRFEHKSKIRVASPADIAALPAGSFDLIVANSVVQYLGSSQVGQNLVEWRRLLAPGGKLVLGDVIPSDVSALKDAAALLAFAYSHGFLVTACTGLVRTLFSDYRSKRAELGLLRFSEREMLDLLQTADFTAKRQAKNIGHNPYRMTFVAQAAA